MEQIKCDKCDTLNTNKSKYCVRCGYELPKITIENLQNSIQNEPKFDFKNNLRLKKMATFFLGMIILLVIFLIFPSQPPAFDKAMMEIASELNKTLPVMINTGTRLDNTIVLPNNSFQYFFTLTDAEKSYIDIDEIKKDNIPRTVNAVKTSPELKIFRDNNTTLVYSYKDKNGVFLFQFSVTPEMYK